MTYGDRVVSWRALSSLGLPPATAILGKNCHQTATKPLPLDPSDQRRAEEVIAGE
jgi:hypothetical protein